MRATEVDPAAPPASPSSCGAAPVAVVEVLLASDQQAMAGSPLAISGRKRLSVGGTAAVVTSLCCIMDAAGLSCCASPEHHGFSSAPDSPLLYSSAWPQSRWGEMQSPVSPRSSCDEARGGGASSYGSSARRGFSMDEAREPAGVSRADRQSSGPPGATLMRISSCRLMPAPLSASLAAAVPIPVRADQSQQL